MNTNKTKKCKGMSVHLRGALIEEARLTAKVMGRSVSRQVEYWATLGKEIEDRPDASFSEVIATLRGIETLKEGKCQELEGLYGL